MERIGPTQSAGCYSLPDYRQALFSASSVLSQKVGAVQNPKPDFSPVNEEFELQAEVELHRVSK